MEVQNYIPKDLEGIFKYFKYRPSGEIKHLRCIAYEGTVSDEIYAVYQMYVDGAPYFYGVLLLDHDDGREQHTIDAFKNWSRSTGIDLIERTDNEYLFTLQEPFGIVYSKK